MSYLGWPRLHFAGTFVTDPSTVNNDPNHYRNAGFNRTTAWDPAIDGSWNPDGRHSFRFESVTVRSAVGPAGEAVAGDPVLGMRFVTRGASPAKLVDLDPDQQLVSTLFGARFALVDAANSTLFEGLLETVAFTDIWRRGSTGAGDEAASASYQSTLEVTAWGDLSGSAFLAQLRAAAPADVLSIKFNVDGYSMQRTLAGGAPNPRFTRGRVLGTVGPAGAGEPAHTVVGRQFGSEVHPPGSAFPSFRPASGVNYFPAVVDAAAGKVRLDLGNALPAAAAGGPAEDIGALALACRASDGSVTEIATIEYRVANWSETTAGVVDLPANRALTADEAALVDTGRLLLLATRAGVRRTVSEEAVVHVRADEFVTRLDPGDPWVVRLHVTRRGRPLAGAQVNLFLLLPADPDAADQFPVGGLTIPDAVTSDANGIAEATLVAADPGEPRFFYSGGRRQHVDGQVYRVGYQVDGVAQANPSNHLSVLVWNTFVPDEPPTWHGSMRRVLTQYGNLYPWMTKFGPTLDLAVYAQVAERAADIVDVLGLPITDPRYMPVSRDMSRSRRQAMLRWLTNPGPDGNPLLGVAPPAEPEPGPEPGPEVAAAAAPGARPDAELGGKTEAGLRTHIAPR